MSYEYNDSYDLEELIDTLNNKINKIADLEAKLAEKDKAIENWQTMYQSVMQSCHNSIEEDKRLREQLAEKEKEIAFLKGFKDAVKSDIRNQIEGLKKGL